jgi:hypothetical protein
MGLVAICTCDCFGSRKSMTGPAQMWAEIEQGEGFSIESDQPRNMIRLN